MTRPGKWIKATVLALGVAALPWPAAALDNLDFRVEGDDADLSSQLENASLLHQAQLSGMTDPREILAAARADYTRILGSLYAAGHYGGTIHIAVDGREAASIPAYADPGEIRHVVVEVMPGPLFRFSTALIGPLPTGAVPASGFETGEPAFSTAVRDAAGAAVSDWRDAGHAQAEVDGQRIVADHRASTLDARIAMDPGPLVHFGDLLLLTPSAVRAERIARIAGLPSGEVFSPEVLERVAARLRRTGAFASVALTETEVLGPGDTMDIGLSVADEKPRRYGFGAVASSSEGISLSGFWLHRNLLGGAERLRLEADISGVTGEWEGMDFGVSARLDIPAAFGTDIDAFVTADAAYSDDPAYLAIQAGAAAGIHRRFTDSLEGEIGVAYHYAYTEDSFGERRFSLLSVPAAMTWDARDIPLDATSGFYLGGSVEPLYDFTGDTLALHGTVDARAYWGVGEDDRFVFAGRAQAGMLTGAGAADVPPEYLFFAGGSDTVRGFPYQSLGIDMGGDLVGARAFLGLSGEVRYRLNDSFGLVAFADAARIGAEGFFDTVGDWQVGAGAGLRYYTGFGPIRLDVATPVSGPGGDGFKIYLGIGQAF